MVSGTLAQASLLLADLHHNPDSARSSRAEFPASWGGGVKPEKVLGPWTCSGV